MFNIYWIHVKPNRMANNFVRFVAPSVSSLKARGKMERLNHFRLMAERETC